MKINDGELDKVAGIEVIGEAYNLVKCKVKPLKTNDNYKRQEKRYK